MKLLSRFAFPGLVIVLAISFWSSGVFLIRILNSLNIWSPHNVQLWLVYGFSVPLIFIAIGSVQNLFTRLFTQPTNAVYKITGLVLTIHALTITHFPVLYFFTPSPGLYATAWLLWFGGITILVQSLRECCVDASIRSIQNK